jgi:hypothetical protein
MFADTCIDAEHLTHSSLGFLGVCMLFGLLYEFSSFLGDFQEGKNGVGLTSAVFTAYIF